MKGNAILEKAQTKDGQVKTRLIDESIDKIKCALEINLFMVEAIDDLASALFVKEEYSESLAALNRVLALQPESTKTWADVALVLTKLDRWDEALEPVNKAWKLAEKQMLDEQMMRLILVRRATILHHQKRYKDAWRDIFQAWQIDAFGIIRNQSIHRMLWEIMDAAPSVEGYWLDLEILWYLASEYKKMGEHEAAQSAVNSVAYILARMTHLENITGEVIVSGVVEGSLVVAVLERSFERLQKTEDKTFVEEQFAWVEDLFKRIYQDKPDFLDKYKL
jgi:tetratricopeptide (TPR) repeat protein